MADVTLKHVKEVYDQTKAARSAAERLEPLLQLLDDPQMDGPSPIENLQEVLETILNGQRLLHQSMIELHEKIDRITGSRRHA
ncbi:hypothetical protein [Gellertiella hungarica]|uniref:hypothetical protein n=1 Tax=Gellertiella hungarica TaxID=1572859 RepID=UPI0035EFF868